MMREMTATMSPSNMISINVPKADFFIYTPAALISSEILARLYTQITGGTSIAGPRIVTGGGIGALALYMSKKAGTSPNMRQRYKLIALGGFADAILSVYESLFGG